MAAHTDTRIHMYIHFIHVDGFRILTRTPQKPPVAIDRETFAQWSRADPRSS